MSRSNNTDLTNPAKPYFIEWKGSTGELQYFDRDKGEKGENVKIPLPFYFLPLDRLSTIKGFSDADQSGYWSNEIRNTKKEILTVRTKKGIVASDLYENLAPILNQGASYCQSLYMLFMDTDKTWKIGNFQIHGSAIGEWITICKGKNIFKGAFSITGKTPMKKGATNYFVPIFSFTDKVSEATEALAMKNDKILQEYLNAYFNNQNARENSETLPAEIVEDEYKPSDAELSASTNKDIPPADPVFVPNTVSDDLPFMWLLIPTALSFAYLLNQTSLLS